MDYDPEQLSRLVKTPDSMQLKCSAEKKKRSIQKIKWQLKSSHVSINNNASRLPFHSPIEAFPFWASSGGDNGMELSISSVSDKEF